jgi:hypothetical protein
MVATVVAFHAFLCQPELEMRATDPVGWELMYGSDALSTVARCVLFSVAGLMSGLVPLFVVTLLYRLRRYRK